MQARVPLDLHVSECQNQNLKCSAPFIMVFQRNHLREFSALLSLLAAFYFTHGTTAAEDIEGCREALGQTVNTGTLPLGNSLRVLSWNIQKAGTSGWVNDLFHLGQDVQLAFIQEASLQAPIEQTIPVPLYQAFAAGYTTASLATGVLTLSSAAPNAHCAITTREPWLGTPKATSITQYTLAGPKRLLAVNMHGVNFTLGVNDFQQQLNALNVLMEDHVGPIIFGGDLNTWSEARQDLVDVFTLRHDLRPVTFEPDLRTRAFGRALDHIYIRGLQPMSARVVPVSSSDHNPLLVHLEVVQ
jgi:endonuclease/exonuclease/phosphatase (EEP) superfamily protein YafD